MVLASILPWREKVVAKKPSSFIANLNMFRSMAALYQKGLHLGYMITAYYYLLSMQMAREINNEEPINNRIGTTPFLATNFLKSAFVVLSPR